MRPSPTLSTRWLWDLGQLPRQGEPQAATQATSPPRPSPQPQPPPPPPTHTLHGPQPRAWSALPPASQPPCPRPPLCLPWLHPHPPLDQEDPLLDQQDPLLDQQDPLLDQQAALLHGLLGQQAVHLHRLQGQQAVHLRPLQDQHPQGLWQWARQRLLQFPPWLSQACGQKQKPLQSKGQQQARAKRMSQGPRSPRLALVQEQQLGGQQQGP
ncbi:hypothetical protein V8C86DRAFT_2694362 [Haematococcus lacustris]